MSSGWICHKRADAAPVLNLNAAHNTRTAQEVVKSVCLSVWSVRPPLHVHDFLCLVSKLSPLSHRTNLTDEMRKGES